MLLPVANHNNHPVCAGGKCSIHDPIQHGSPSDDMQNFWQVRTHPTALTSSKDNRGEHTISAIP